jgi:hypothetical protein
MPRGKQSGIAFGQRNQRGQSDTAQLIKIAKYIKDRWHLQFKREWYVGFDRETGGVRRIVESVNRSEASSFKWRNPDLLHIHKSVGLIIIEIDGSIHDKKTDETERRNKQYVEGYCKLIVINLKDIRFANRTVEEEIDWKMMKLLSGAPTGIV